MRSSIIVLAGISPFLVACGASNSGTATNFGIISGFDQNVVLTSTVDGEIENLNIGRVTFEAGFDETNNRYVGTVSLAQGTDVGNPGSGSATYSGNYSFVYIDQVNSGQPLPNRENGSIDLAVNFNNSTITGSSADTIILTNLTVVPELSISGTISGTVVGGTGVAGFSDALTNGTQGVLLQGEVGADGLIFGFYGNDDDTVVVGGAIGVAPPP